MVIFSLFTSIDAGVGKKNFDFCYEGCEHDLRHWNDDYPSCAGLRQSPIDLVVDEAIKLDTVRPISYQYKRHKEEDINDELEIVNNGHSLTVS